MQAVMITFLVFNSLAVGARVYCRAFLVKAFGWDDVFICLAFVRSPCRTLFLQPVHCLRTDLFGILTKVFDFI